MAIRVWLPILALTVMAPQPSGGAENIDAMVIGQVDFERHVAPLFSRLGCNAGACHGKFDGQGGLRLSLFGEAPTKDYLAVAGDRESRRVVVEAPEESLILAKPSRHTDHEGGLRMPDDSWQYAIVRRWIAQRARHVAGSGEVRKLVLQASVGDIHAGQCFPPGLESSSLSRRQAGKPDPRGVPLDQDGHQLTVPGKPQKAFTPETMAALKLAPGETPSLRVIAEFADGTIEDVTAFAEFRSSDERVGTVNAAGQATAVGPGCASLIAAYSGSFAQASVLVPYPPAEGSVSRLPPANFIDEVIDRQLDALGLASSPPASDAEFLRRAALDVLGTLPDVGTVRDFLANGDSDKRRRAIDCLLAHPRRAAVWASRMCDVTACNVDSMEMPEALRPKRAKMWYDWLRRRFAENVPYDELARGVLTATSRGDQPIDRWIEGEIALQHAAENSFESDYALRPSLDLFWRRTAAGGPPPVEDLTELIASAFLGLRLHCARCHHHPYDRWSQRDFAGFAQIFARVQFGASTELRSEINRQLEERRRRRTESSLPREDEQGKGIPTLPRLQEVYVSATGRPLIDAAAEASAPAKVPAGPVIEASTDPRRAFVSWLTQPDNPFFAKSFVNRIWAKYFGVGLVEPIDDMSASNPSRHPELLDRLAAEFVRSGYDIKHIERLILSSNAYQRSTSPAGNNAADSHNFARAIVRPLPVESLIDALNTALESSDDFGPDVPAGSAAHEVAPNRLTGAHLDTVFRLLGRGDRRSLCDCDRATGPSIRQPIFLMSDPVLLAKVPTGRLARLIEALSDDRAIISELYLATLSRYPEQGELDFLQNQVAAAADRRAALTDILWAILNTKEFSTNH